MKTSDSGRHVFLDISLCETAGLPDLFIRQLWNIIKFFNLIMMETEDTQTD